MEILILDLNNFEKHLGTYEKCDSLTLKIKLEEDKDYEGCKFRILAKKSDNNYLEQIIEDIEVNTLEKTILTELNQEFSTKEGLVKLEINISKKGKENTTKEAFFIINNTINSEIVESKSIIPTLENVDNYIKEANSNLSDLKLSEEERKINERERNDRENLRREAEKLRKSNEIKREAAEEERSSNYANNENKRKEDFEAAELKRTESYSNAEKNRNNSFQTEENERANTFRTKEEERILTFINNENEREENFEIAELKRNETELLRVEAENLRVAAEEERKQTLINVEANVKRIDGALKEHIDNHPTGGNGETSIEVIEARRGFFGKEHLNLKERLDEEFNFQNKGQKGEFIEQVETHSHSIQNTIVGITKDMIIKGRTLQNLCTTNNSITTVIGQDKFITNDLKFNWIVGKTYTIIVTTDGSCRFDVSFRSGNNTVIDSLPTYEYPAGTNIIKITPTKECTVNPKLVLGARSSTSVVNITNLFVVDDDIDFIPSYFEGIKNFGQEENKISIFSFDKYNLFTEWVADTIIDVNSGELKVGLGSSAWKIKKIKGGTNYIFNKNSHIIGMDASGKSRYYGVISANTPFTTDVNHIELRGYKASTDLENPVFYEGVSLENQQDKKDILLPWEGGLSGFGNVADELNSISRKVVKRIDKVALNGEEVGKGLGWELWSVLEDTIKFKLNDDRFINSRYKEVLSNKLPWASGNMTILDKKTGNFIASCYPGANGLGLVVGIRISELPTPNLEGFKSLLKQWHNEDNPLIVYYELATPVEYPLDTDINLNTYDSVTHINFENVIEGTSSFKAPINTTQMLARLDAENRVLREENIRLKAGTYKNTEDISITNEELQATQSAVDFILFNGGVGLNEYKIKMPYNGTKNMKGGESMGAYLAMRIMKGMLTYDEVIKQYGEFKEDIDTILRAEGYGHLIK